MAKLEHETDKVLAEVAQKGVTEHEVERAKNGLTTRLVAGLQTIGGFGGIADTLNRYNQYTGDPGYFVTERQRRRLAERGSDFAKGTVGAVARDVAGNLAAATSTGGRRGQLPGRVGDSPVFVAGTWADEHAAISCTGDGEAFVRAAAAHGLATRLAAGTGLDAAARQTLADVRRADGIGGLIAVAADGDHALEFTSAAMNRAVWREGSEPDAWV